MLTKSVTEPQATQIVEKYNAFVSLIDELDLTTAADAKPLLDVGVNPPRFPVLSMTICQGREVVAALGAQKPGQWTGQALASIVEWQLGHPTGTKDECIAWLKDERDAGRIKSEDPPRTSAPGQAKRPKDNDGAAKKARHTSQV
jgi:tRNA nucleotidyltransferase (CCA-adding enzyme)